MKRKESKIPLLIAFIGICLFIYWALGYVERNRPAQAPQQPVVSLARPAEVSKPDQQAVVTPPSPVAVQPAQTAQTVQTAPVQQANPGIGPMSGDDVPVRQTQNRKLMGSAEVATQKR